MARPWHGLLVTSAASDFGERMRWGGLRLRLTSHPPFRATRSLGS
jgi:hypothetical protein